MCENSNASGVKPEPCEHDAQNEHFFPLFVNLRGRRATVVGGGRSAAKRIRILYKFGASVRVIAPDLSAETAGLVREGKASWLCIGFAPQLLMGADLVVAATGIRRVNQNVAEAAKDMQLLVSVEDSREESSYLFPTIVENETLIAGIVARNDNHAAVKRFAQKLLDRLLGK